MNHSTLLDRILQGIEKTGNRLPHPTLLFIWLSLFILVLSWLLSLLQIQAVHPVSQITYKIVNLINAEGLQKVLGKAVTNFTQFAPVGVVLVVMLGVGIAEYSGLIACVLKKMVRRTSNTLLAYLIAFAGIISSIGADVGYVVLIPIAAMIYQSLGRSPLAGIAVAFAGVSAGYSANLLIGPVDVILSSISTEAALLSGNAVQVNASDNYYFIIVSTFLISLVCGWLSNNVIEPRLIQQNKTARRSTERIDDEEKTEQTLKPVAWFTLIYIIILALLVLTPNGALASKDIGSSPLLKNIVPIIALYFGLAGYIFGKTNQYYKTASDAVQSMEKSIQTMAYYIVLMFFAAQFVNYFSWSNIGIVTAINGAAWLGSLQLPVTVLLVGIVLFTALINLFVGSASAKWVLLAPVFVPMLILLNIPPEQTQIAYRVGDSVTNIITPLMPYFGIVLAYAQRYQRELGLGNIIAMMLPYSLSLLLAWGTLIVLWIGFDLPLGP